MPDPQAPEIAALAERNSRMSRGIYDGEPYYCQLCGAGGGEFFACEMPDCKLESKASAEKRAEDHQRLMDHAEVASTPLPIAPQETMREILAAIVKPSDPSLADHIRRGLADTSKISVAKAIAAMTALGQSHSPATVDVWEKLARTASLLQQNSEGCAINHYGHDCDLPGMPGWLADTKRDIDEARLEIIKLKGGTQWSTKPTETTEPNWARCPSTHCERRQECASPNDCIVRPPQPPATVERELVEALRDIAAERQRQISVEGWTPEHDNKHDDGQMALAGAAYALASVWPFHYWGNEWAKKIWPWDAKWWKPGGGKRRNLIKAGALIVAEIERLDRKALATASQPEARK